MREKNKTNKCVNPYEYNCNAVFTDEHVGCIRDIRSQIEGLFEYNVD